MFEEKTTQISIVLIVSFFALILPQVFVPILAGMLIAQINMEGKRRG
jgi:hypothetical protein